MRIVLFDFDGTIVQTREASWAVFRQTSEKFGLGIDTRDAYFSLFEGNVFETLRRRCEDNPSIEVAIEHFVKSLQSQYNPDIIPGMVDVIRALAGRMTLAVVSSNATDTIRDVLAEAGLAHCFAHVFAGDVEPDKSAAIGRFVADRSYALRRRCTPAYAEGDEPQSLVEIVLVTDTAGDVREAVEAGIRAIGVAWGMHTEAALLEAGAERVAIWPQELIAWLGGDVSCEDACSCAVSPTEQPKDVDDRLEAAATIRRARRGAPSRSVGARHAVAPTPDGPRVGAAVEVGAAVRRILRAEISASGSEVSRYNVPASARAPGSLADVVSTIGKP